MKKSSLSYIPFLEVIIVPVNAMIKPLAIILTCTTIYPAKHLLHLILALDHLFDLFPSFNSHRLPSPLTWVTPTFKLVWLPSQSIHHIADLSLFEVHNYSCHNLEGGFLLVIHQWLPAGRLTLHHARQPAANVFLQTHLYLSPPLCQDINLLSHDRNHCCSLLSPNSYSPVMPTLEKLFLALYCAW